MDNHVNMMYIHVFAAYFGLTVSCCLPRPLPTRGKEKDQTATSPSLFAMLGKNEAGVGGLRSGVSKKLPNCSVGRPFSFANPP